MIKLDIREAIYVPSRGEWRAWLETNHARRKQAWLLLYKKGSKKQGISYAEAVEEAICYGWIDGIVKGIDGEKYAQRFTPRKEKSNWTSTNRKLA